MTLDVLTERPRASLSEGQLWRGYSVPTVSRGCLCGGVIEAPNSPGAIAEAVLLHNLSTVHERWAIAEGWR